MTRATLEAARARLAAGQPLRILIGHAMHDAIEIVPVPAFGARLAALVDADLVAQLAELNPPDPPAAPAAQRMAS